MDPFPCPTFLLAFHRASDHQARLAFPFPWAFLLVHAYPYVQAFHQAYHLAYPDLRDHQACLLAFQTYHRACQAFQDH